MTDDDLMMADLPYRNRVEVYGLNVYGLLLCGMRADTIGDYIGTFGGGMELGESPTQSAEREFMEESGYCLQEAHLVDPDPFQFDFRRPKLKGGKYYRGTNIYFVYGVINPNIPHMNLDLDAHELVESTIKFRPLEDAIKVLLSYHEHDSRQRARTRARIDTMIWIQRRTEALAEKKQASSKS